MRSTSTLHPSQRRALSADLVYLMADTDDLVQLENTTQEAVLDHLQLLWERDRAMHLVLILLDGQAEPETRQMAAECLADSLTLEDAAAFVAHRLYARPLPDSADTDGACRLARSPVASNVVEFFERLVAHQRYIRDRVLAWQALPPDMFTSEDERKAVEAVLIHRGYFYRLALAANDIAHLDQIIFDAQFEPAIRRVASYGAVLASWKQRFETREATPDPTQTPKEDFAVRQCMIVAHGDPLVAASLCRSFRRIGWDVYQARTGPEARRLARLLAPEPEVLILAADLDEESGWLTCEKITRELLHAKVFLVADTSDPENQRLATFAGAAGLIDPKHSVPSVVQTVCGHMMHAAG